MKDLEKTTRVWIKNITLNHGEKIYFDKNDIIVFVGPNNSGKSASLKEIHQLIKSRNSGVIVKNIELVKEGTEEEFIEHISSISVKTDNPNGPHYSGFNYSLHERDAKAAWLKSENSLGNITAMYVNLLSTEARLSEANPAQNIEIRKIAPGHPIHFLQKDLCLEEKINKYFRKAFGMDLVLDVNSGSIVPLRVGEKPKVGKTESKGPGSEYDKKLEKLPELQHQGDGMRSFVGVLLNTFISKYSIQLIDEPETFLHPPQTRLLGEMLGKNMHHDCQIFLSTHSEDFLKGLLDSENKNIKIIRIRREENKNTTSQLEKNDINNIWSDSLLKHSNILSGLFHKKVVLCEADSDCKFYSAILSSLLAESEKTNPDILFLPCGGKGRIPMVIKSLKKLDVPIWVIADFDVIENENKTVLENIFRELGGDWDEIKEYVEKINNHINSKNPKQFEKEELRLLIEKHLGTVDGELIPTDKILDIKNSLKISKFLDAKKNGVNCISCNETKEIFISLNLMCKKYNLMIIEVGEIESFVRSIKGHGTKWVNEVLSNKNIKEDKELHLAREFIEQLL